MSYIIASKEINEYVDNFIIKNNLCENYGLNELMQSLYQILGIGYKMHSWKHNNFAVYTLSRICHKHFNYDILDIEEVFYFYFKRDMRSNVMVSLSGVESLEFEDCVRSSVMSYIDIIKRDICKLEIIILNEWLYDCMLDSYDKYRVCGYLGNNIVKYFYDDFVDKNFEKIVRYVKEIMELYYKLYKIIGKIMEYYMFSYEGKEEREIALLQGKGDLLMMSKCVFNKINYLDLFDDFKMKDDGRIEIINNYAFYKKWCDLSRL